MSETLLTLRGRRSRGLVAARTGVPASTLADLERGNVQLKVLENLLRLADYYGVSLEYLVRGDKNHNRTEATEWAETTAQILSTMRETSRNMTDGVNRVAALMEDLERKRAENLSTAQRFIDALSQIAGEEMLDEYLEALLAVARGDGDALGRLDALLALGQSEENSTKQF